MDILDTAYQDIITTFVLKTILHHVGMLCIIKTYEKLKYDIDKQNSEFVIDGPWNNTSICNKLHGKVSEGFIKNARTDRYNSMCSVDAHKKYHQSSCDDGSSGEGFPILSNSATEALDFIGATIYFICCWIEALEHNFIERCNLYAFNRVNLFQKVPFEIPNQPIPK